MMTVHPYYVVNAFSEEGEIFSGNPAGVLLNGDTIIDKDLRQSIARQLNLVETVFVCAPTKKADFRFLYFTPTKELPVTGHPTVAALWALHENNRIKDEKTIHIETAAGLLEAWFDQGYVWITQRPPAFRSIPLDSYKLAETFGLKAQDIQSTTAPEVSDTGLGHIIVELRSIDALERAIVNIEALKILCESVGAREAQLFSIDDNGAYHTRNLCPRWGEEDPACGNGNAALGAWLAKCPASYRRDLIDRARV
jgi:trans-2,3-dihydro-3-hydroxyanthranilate isomerase